MAHEAQERYSALVLAKIRQENKLKNGVVFNTDYEGSPKAGVVKIPVRDAEVEVSDYDRANGIPVKHGSTSYINFPIDKEKAVNELIDGYDAQLVPDNLVADRLYSAGYALAVAEDTDGATVLLAGATVTNIGALTVDGIYSDIVDIRQQMSEANIPDDGRRYLLVTPATYSFILKSPEFVKASSLGDNVVQSGIVGRIAGFNVIEWNDKTAGLAMIAGHPRFATRAEEFSVPVHLQDMNGSGKYIGASAVQGRIAYAHKVLRSVAIRAVYAPGSLKLAAAAGSTKGKTVITVAAGGDASGTYAYKVNPSARAVYGETSAAYAGTALTSGTTEIAAAEGNVIEVVCFNSDSKAATVGYITVTAANIKA